MLHSILVAVRPVQVILDLSICLNQLLSKTSLEQMGANVLYLTHRMLKQKTRILQQKEKLLKLNIIKHSTNFQHYY